VQTLFYQKEAMKRLVDSSRMPLKNWPSEKTRMVAQGHYHCGTSNHPFIDGNKRVAFYASVGFLRLNGVHLHVGEADAAVLFIALAAGELSEKELASWFRGNSVVA